MNLPGRLDAAWSALAATFPEDKDLDAAWSALAATFPEDKDWMRHGQRWRRPSRKI
jgi:hypothetical protein